MTIKEKIGQRIMDERKAKGLTRKALAELTGELKVSRINNYERGDRTPGPEEIKLLADALEVPASYLMCLTDNKDGSPSKSPGLGLLLPILNYKQASNPAAFMESLNDDMDAKVEFLPAGSSLSDSLGDSAFALLVQDDSMAPEFRTNDILIIDSDTKPRPGDVVVALLDGEQEVIVRKYKQLSAAKGAQEYELIALNEDWANVHVNGKDTKAQIIGCGISVSRRLRG